MKTIEFTTKMENGTIKVPTKYLNSLGEKFKVVIVLDDKSTSTKCKKNRVVEKNVEKKRIVKAFQVKTKDFVFDRNEANKR